LPGGPLGKRRPTPGTPPTPGAAPAPTATTPSGTPPTGTTGVTGSNQLIGDKDFNTCKKFPSGKRIVKLNLKPDTELGDLIAWISSITCRQFLLPGTIPANSKKVTVVAPELITPEEAYKLFLGALDSAGLTVEHFGKFERIVETAKIKTMGGIPVYGEGVDVPSSESYVTRLVRVENVDPNEVATVLGRLKGEQGDIVVFVPQNALIITDLASNINRMMKVLRDIDQPGAGEKVWIISLKNTAAAEMAQKLAEIFQVQQVGKGKGGGAPAAPAGVSVSSFAIRDSSLGFCSFLFSGSRLSIPPTWEMNPASANVYLVCGSIGRPRNPPPDQEMAFRTGHYDTWNITQCCWNG
jgi:general secretion pathway protein D